MSWTQINKKKDNENIIKIKTEDAYDKTKYKWDPVQKKVVYIKTGTKNNTTNTTKAKNNKQIKNTDLLKNIANEELAWKKNKKNIIAKMRKSKPIAKNEEESGLLNLYAQHGYHKMNEFLRTGDIKMPKVVIDPFGNKHDGEKLKNQWIQKTEKLKNIIENNKMPYDALVNRIVKVSPQRAKQIFGQKSLEDVVKNQQNLIGKPLKIDKGFISTSASHDVDMNTINKKQNNVEYIIKVPKGSKAQYIGRDIQMGTNENEVLIAPNSDFTFAGAVKDNKNKRYKIYLNLNK